MSLKHGRRQHGTLSHSGYVWLVTAACLPPIRRIPFKKNTCFAGARIQPTNQSGAPENQSKQPPKDVASSLPHSTTFACEVV
jgi:hypothetical protein